LNANRFLTVTGSALLAAGALAAGHAFAALPGCTAGALSALNVPSVTVTSAADVAATATAPEYCHVLGSVASPSGNPNGDGFSFDLPAGWNGRFLMGGGGGFTGSTNGPNVSALSQGYAVASTDTGHTVGNATFAITAPHVRAEGAVIDYFYLAMHNVTVAGKQMTREFYKSPSIKYSYFQGCSTGGRQALMEARRYPEDFDGIIAGDAFSTHHLVLEQLKGELALLQPGAYIPASLAPAIDAAVYAECDAKDGVKDSLIQNPPACGFNPQTIVCGAPGVSPSACLSQAQADALKNYIRPITTGDGHQVIPGYPITDLGGGDGMQIWFLGLTVPVSGSEPWGSPFGPPFSWSFADQTLKYLVYEDPNYDTFNFGMSPDGRIDGRSLELWDKMTRAGNADDPEALQPFLRKGGKLLIYHGFSDGGLSPYRTIDLYKELADRAGGYRDLQRDARLFLVPGMHHCAGGPGPNVFDTLTPLQKWVENGVAPDAIPASHFTGTTVDRTMPLCKFPEQARYSGKGDVKNAANWSCPDHDRSLLHIGPNGAEAGLSAGEESDD